MTSSVIPISSLWEYYKETRSVWKTGEYFGLAGQSVHERLQKNGYKLYGQKFSKEEDDAIKLIYSMSPGVKDLNLRNLAITLGRPHHTNIARRAKELGLTDKDRKNTLQQRDSQSQNRLQALQAGTLSRTYENVKKGWFESSTGNKYFLKSSWETKYAKYLETLLKGRAIQEWSYEPETFWFLKIKRGVRSYTPDFRVVYKDGSVEYHEVKGWMDDRSKVKIKRMRIYHPHIKLRVLMKADLKEAGVI